MRWTSVADKLGEQDFYRKDHRLIWRAITELGEQGHALRRDHAWRLVRSEQPGRDGGRRQLSGGAGQLDAQRGEHRRVCGNRAREIRAASVDRRRYRDYRRRLSSGRQSVHEVLENAEQRVFHIAESGARGRKDTVSMREAVKDAFRLLHERYQNRGQLTGISTGFTDLDNLTSGLQPSDSDHHCSASVDG
jgi:replicative DNA helicase